MGGGEGGGGGAESFDSVKAWTFLNNSVLYGENTICWTASNSFGKLLSLTLKILLTEDLFLKISPRTFGSDY